tara:strand:- start:10816 stop:11643 length:828 start_codon:yes stop_codon:yes gene_type:complete
MKGLVIFLLGLTNISGFILNKLPVTNNVFGREILEQFGNNENVNYFKKYESRVKDSKKLAIFLPALTGNSATAGLYENFLNIMTRKAFDVYVPDNDIQPILNDINNTNCDITLIAHSSSAMSAISMTNAIDNIKTLVLIDPLDVNNKDTRPPRKVDYDVADINLLSKPIKDNKEIQVDNLDKLLVINTKKSNDWSIMPFIFPVGILALKTNRLVLDGNITQEVVKADDFGHFDILDDKWSNMIHNTLSRGCEDRDPAQLEIFRAWISNKINEVTS